MEKIEHTLKPKQRVKLKDGYDECYNIARSGAQAYVMDVMEDPMGYPCALIKWDKNHWTYDGESDGWAYQSHFEPVKDVMPEEIDPNIINSVDPQLLTQVIAAIKAAAGDKPTSDVTLEDLKAAQLVEARKAVIEELEDTEAFLLISISRVNEDGEIILDPQVISYSKSEEGVLAVGAQMNALASMSAEQMILDRLDRISQDKKEKSE